MKDGVGNLGPFSTVRQLAAIVKNRLKRSQYRPDLMDGCLAQTGLSLETRTTVSQTQACLMTGGRADESCRSVSSKVQANRAQVAGGTRDGPALVEKSREIS
jgi:hypothetical protein